MFNERDLDNNPYTEVTQGNAGKVEFETDNNLIKFHPINLKSTYSNRFEHRIHYTLFLTDSFKVMRYAKNCGKFMIDQAFSDPYVLKFEKVISYRKIEDISKDKSKLTIQLDKLKNNTKYYGVLVAKVDLYPLDSGYISPVRSGKAFYDEFVFVTPRFDIPFNLIISIVIILGFLTCLFCIIKAYIFGRINKMEGLERLSDLS